VFTLFDLYWIWGWVGRQSNFLDGVFCSFMFGVFVPASCGHKVVTTSIVVLLLLCVVCCPVAAGSGGSPSIPDSTKLCTGCTVSEVESWKIDPFESNVVSKLILEQSTPGVLVGILSDSAGHSIVKYDLLTLRDISEGLVKSGFTYEDSSCVSYDVLKGYLDFKNIILKPFGSELPDGTGARLFIWVYMFKKSVQDKDIGCIEHNKVFVSQYRFGVIQSESFGEVVRFVGDPFVSSVCIKYNETSESKSVETDKLYGSGIWLLPDGERSVLSERFSVVSSDSLTSVSMVSPFSDSLTLASGSLTPASGSLLSGKSPLPYSRKYIDDLITNSDKNTFFIGEDAKFPSFVFLNTSAEFDSNKQKYEQVTSGSTIVYLDNGEIFVVPGYCSWSDWFWDVAWCNCRDLIPVTSDKRVFQNWSSLKPKSSGELCNFVKVPKNAIKSVSYLEPGHTKIQNTIIGNRTVLTEVFVTDVTSGQYYVFEEILHWGEPTWFVVLVIVDLLLIAACGFSVYSVFKAGSAAVAMVTLTVSFFVGSSLNSLVFLQQKDPAAISSEFYPVDARDFPIKTITIMPTTSRRYPGDIPIEQPSIVTADMNGGLHVTIIKTSGQKWYYPLTHHWERFFMNVNNRGKGVPVYGGKLRFVVSDGISVSHDFVTHDLYFISGESTVGGSGNLVCTFNQPVDSVGRRVKVPCEVYTESGYKLLTV